MHSLNGNELSELRTDQLGCDLQGAQTDQVAAALAQPEAHKALLRVDQGVGVVALEPHRSAAAGQADALLDLVFAGGGGGHATCCWATNPP